MKKGNTLLEYATLIIIFALAILLMQNYLVRGLASRWRSVGDTFGYGKQYQPDGVNQTVVTETSP